MKRLIAVTALAAATVALVPAAAQAKTVRLKSVPFGPYQNEVAFSGTATLSGKTLTVRVPRRGPQDETLGFGLFKAKSGKGSPCKKSKAQGSRAGGWGRGKLPIDSKGKGKGTLKGKKALGRGTYYVNVTPSPKSRGILLCGVVK